MADYGASLLLRLPVSHTAAIVEAVKDWLAATGWRFADKDESPRRLVAVQPDEAGWTGVYDQMAERGDLEALHEAASRCSAALKCVAIVSVRWESAALGMALFVDGREVDRFLVGEARMLGSVGTPSSLGHPARWARALERQTVTQELPRLLRSVQSVTPEALVAILDCLGIPKELASAHTETVRATDASVLRLVWTRAATPLEPRLRAVEARAYEAVPVGADWTGWAEFVSLGRGAAIERVVVMAPAPHLVQPIKCRVMGKYETHLDRFVHLQRAGDGPSGERVWTATSDSWQIPPYLPMHGTEAMSPEQRTARDPLTELADYESRIEVHITGEAVAAGVGELHVYIAWGASGAEAAGASIPIEVTEGPAP